MPPYQPYRPPPSVPHDPSFPTTKLPAPSPRRPLAPSSSWPTDFNTSHYSSSIPSNFSNMNSFTTPSRKLPPLGYTPLHYSRAYDTPVRKYSSSPYTIVESPMPQTPSIVSIYGSTKSTPASSTRKRKADTMDEAPFPSIPRLPAAYDALNVSDHLNEVMPAQPFPRPIPAGYTNQDPAPHRYRKQDERSKGHSANPWDYVDLAPGRCQFSPDMLSIMQCIYLFIDRHPKPVERERLAAWFGKRSVPVDTWFQNARQTEKSSIKTCPDSPAIQTYGFDLSNPPLGRVRVAAAICRGELPHSDSPAAPPPKVSSGTLDSLLHARAINHKKPAQTENVDVYSEHYHLLSSLSDSRSSSPIPCSTDEDYPPKRRAVEDTPCRPSSRQSMSFDARAKPEDLFAASRRARSLKFSRSMSASPAVSHHIKTPMTIRYEKSFCRSASMYTEVEEDKDEPYIKKLKHRFDETPSRNGIPDGFDVSSELDSNPSTQSAPGSAETQATSVDAEEEGEGASDIVKMASLLVGLSGRRSSDP